MKSSIILLSVFLGVGLATDPNEPAPAMTLPRNTPIYIGERRKYTNKPFVYGHDLIAWLPTSNYCTMSTAIREFQPFSIGEEDPVAPRIDDLIFYGYTGVKAGILRVGNPFATCKIGPGSVRMGKCGVEAENGEDEERERLAEVWKTWTCWVDEFEQAVLAKQARREGKGGNRPAKEETKISGPRNMADPPTESMGEEGTYQKWFCDDLGCGPQSDPENDEQQEE